MTSLLSIKDLERTCSFSTSSSVEDEMVRGDTHSEASQEDTLEKMNVEPTSVEVEKVGKGKHFVHQITSSNPYQVFTVGGKHWWCRRSTRFWVILVFCLFLLILTIAVPASKRKKERRNPTKISGTTEGDVSSGFSGKEQAASTGSSDKSNPSHSGWMPLETDVTSDVGDIELIDEVRTHTVFDPLSNLDPTVYFPNVVRPADSSPSSRLDPLQVVNPSAVPTNAWYQNFLLLRDGETPSMNHQAYTMPYIVDVAGPIPGLRVHFGRVETSADQVIVSVDEPAALTLGATGPLSTSTLDTTSDKGYNVLAATELGLTLGWVRNSVLCMMVFHFVINLSHLI